MTPDIIRKLASELNAGISTEVQVVYLLAGIRKIIERDSVEDQYPDLKFHCDWALHPHMDRTAAKAVLRQFDAALPPLPGKLELHALPEPLRSGIDRISRMLSFQQDLSRFLADYGLPQLAQQRHDEWVRFLRLYAKVIEDIPLVVAVPTPGKRSRHASTGSSPTNISSVTVSVDEAREIIEHGRGEEFRFAVTWTIHDKNGQSHSVSVLNTVPA